MWYRLDLFRIFHQKTYFALRPPSCASLSKLDGYLSGAGGGGVLIRYINSDMCQNAFIRYNCLHSQSNSAFRQYGLPDRFSPSPFVSGFVFVEFNNKLFVDFLRFTHCRLV